MRPKIILHVGTEKTGTTSIQSVLGASYGELLEKGILFPQSIGAPSHINLTACALENQPTHPIRKLLKIEDPVEFINFKTNTLTNIKNEIQKTKPSQIIISDEHINVHLSCQETLLNFKRICEEIGSIKSVIIYLRRQDQFRLSLFSEAVKSGNLSSFDLENPLPVFNAVPYRFSYLEILNNLRSSFGKNLTVRVYDRATFPEGNVCCDFLNQIDVSLQATGTTEENSNKTIDARVIKHLALISLLLKKTNKNWANKCRSALLEKCETLFKGPGVVMNTEIHENFLKQFETQNEIIRRDFFMTTRHQYLFSTILSGNHPNMTTYPASTIPWIKFIMHCITNTPLEPQSNGPAIDKNLHKQLSLGNAQRNNISNAICPVCGTFYLLDLTKPSREEKLCPGCGASGRAQAIAHYLSEILATSGTPLIEHPKETSKKIIGLSDSPVYARILNEKYDYINSFYHREPFLDITSPPDEYREAFDILISTEVFEHVFGPSIKAFQGAFNILKPNGNLILTVPFINKGKSIEHYREDLTNCIARKRLISRKWVADLEYSNGDKETDKDPKFHGGPGQTLEVRLFNRSRLINELRSTGFTDIVVHDENLPQHGINWGPASRVITARKPSQIKTTTNETV
ncbi:MAG: hypothetical protein H8E68_08470 [Kiritimatiellaeota bacterium]|nr:hypothetical protein [Kiritimatiellota bacterium]